MQEPIENILKHITPRDPNYVPPTEEPEEKKKPLVDVEYAKQRIFGEFYHSFEHCNLDEFGQTGKKCIKYLKEGNGLYIYGSVGVGKTSIALACLNWWFEQRREGFIYTISEMLDSYRRCISNRDDHTMNELIKYYSLLDMLVIDDFGVQANTEWASEKIYEVVDTRWKNRDKKVTIVTSNFNPDEVVKRARDEVVADRIVSRLVGMCKRIELLGPDRRIEKS